MLQVRESTYRGQDGYSIVGRDSLDRRVKIFCRLEETARAIVAALKAGEPIDGLLKDELQPRQSFYGGSQCSYVFEGYDDGRELAYWRCQTHGDLSIGWQVPCETGLDS